MLLEHYLRTLDLLLEAERRGHETEHLVDRLRGLWSKMGAPERAEALRRSPPPATMAA